MLNYCIHNAINIFPLNTHRKAKYLKLKKSQDRQLSRIQIEVSMLSNATAKEVEASDEDSNDDQKLCIPLITSTTEINPNNSSLNTIGDEEMNVTTCIDDIDTIALNSFADNVQLNSAKSDNNSALQQNEVVSTHVEPVHEIVKPGNEKYAISDPPPVQEATFSVEDKVSNSNNELPQQSFKHEIPSKAKQESILSSISISGSLTDELRPKSGAVANIANKWNAQNSNVKTPPQQSQYTSRVQDNAHPTTQISAGSTTKLLHDAATKHTPMANKTPILKKSTPTSIANVSLQIDQRTAVDEASPDIISIDHPRTDSDENSSNGLSLTQGDGFSKQATNNARIYSNTSTDSRISDTLQANDTKDQSVLADRPAQPKLQQLQNRAFSESASQIPNSKSSQKSKFSLGLPTNKQFNPSRSKTALENGAKKSLLPNNESNFILMNLPEDSVSTTFSLPTTAEDGIASSAAEVSRVTSAANRGSGKTSTAAPFSIPPETLPSNADDVERTIKDSEEYHFSPQVTSNLKLIRDFPSFSSPFSGLASTVNERKNRQWNLNN